MSGMWIPAPEACGQWRCSSRSRESQIPAWLSRMSSPDPVDRPRGLRECGRCARVGHERIKDGSATVPGCAMTELANHRVALLAILTPRAAGDSLAVNALAARPIARKMTLRAIDAR